MNTLSLMLNTAARGALFLLVPGLFLAVGIVGASGGNWWGAAPWLFLAAVTAGSTHVPAIPQHRRNAQ